MLALTGLGLVMLLTSGLGFSRQFCDLFDSAFCWGPCLGTFALFFVADMHEQTRDAVYQLMDYLGLPFNQANDLRFSSGNTGHYERPYGRRACVW